MNRENKALDSSSLPDIKKVTLIYLLLEMKNIYTQMIKRRKKNLNIVKKIDTRKLYNNNKKWNFERAKFEIIQKTTKKFKE